MLTLNDLTYTLPKELIAQYPHEQRDQCRLLVYHRSTGKTEQGIFAQLKQILTGNDVLVLNTTRVWKARMGARRRTGGKLEVLVVNRVQPHTYEVLLSPSGRIKNGEEIYIGNHAHPKRAQIKRNRQTFLMHLPDRDFERLKDDNQAEVPLPPYITRAPEQKDDTAYQTVYAREEGSIAAPTAGFHFTSPLIAALQDRGVRIVNLVLHIGYGTFKPIGTDRIKEHRMHPEFVTIDPETAAVINGHMRNKRRIIAVGTSATRALESAYSPELDAVVPYSGFTELFIAPPYRFKVVKALITNFHLPRTTLFALVCAFAGTETVHTLYREAIAQKYRFYSYGDAMFIL